MNPTASRIAVLMGTASVLTIASAISAHAQNQQVAQAQVAQEEIPETVLVTGSLIRGTAAVGVPVTNLGTRDFKTSGALSTADLFRTIPVANVAPGAAATNSGGHLEREIRVNIRGLDQTGPRSLLMVDGMRFPPQADGICAIDPSIIPALALDHIDILADGASATYGSDAIAGVLNIILKRRFDGAVTQFNFSVGDAHGEHYQATQLWGRTWDGGGITLTYEWQDEAPVSGRAHSKYTGDYSPWGLDNRIPIGSSMPATLSTGTPSSTLGTTCTNCYAVPPGSGTNFNPGTTGIGPLLPSSAAPFTWASVSSGGPTGTGNEFDPFRLGTGYEIAPQQRNSAVMTIDQRLTKDISFYGSAFYSNRRVQQRVAEGATQVTNDLLRVAVPTFNPYYPTGAPTNLRVAYDIAIEIPPQLNAYELSHRYQYGLNIELPYGWHGQLYDSRSYDTNRYYYIANGGPVNVSAVSAALGWTIGATAAVGTTPAIAAWTKPANIPYLNIFCDARVHTCNSPTTLNYVTGSRFLDDVFTIDERGTKFDGPLFDLPAGQVKAAVGGTYTSFDVIAHRGNNTGTTNLILNPFVDAEPYNVWAGFVQVNIPVFGENFNFPLFRKFDLEGSWRHDQYHGTLQGATSNPKVGFNWLLSEDMGVSIRGGWGTSFRFANAGEYSGVFSDALNDWNLPASANNLSIQCQPSGGPTPGSAAADLYAIGFACNSQPGGLSNAGGPHPWLRNYVSAATGLPTTREGGMVLKPENATNWSLGVEFAPQTILRGLDLQATWYSVKINGVLSAFNNPTGGTVANPTQRFHYILPSDLGCPVAQNATPALCAPFEVMVNAVLADSNNVAPLNSTTLIYWINDGSTANSGFLKVEGIDWQASYDVDLGDFGALNTGIAGTYYLHRYSLTSAGGTIVDEYHQNLAAIGGFSQDGVETLPRMRYRARLGWSNGKWDVTGFVNYQSHFYHTQNSPPNVNLQCTTNGGTAGGGTFPCAISGYSNLLPAWYSFDLSVGYDTGETPANEYLRHVGIQFVVQNLMGIHPAFQYGPSNTGRTIAAYDILKSDQGRTFVMTLTKTW